MDLHENEYIFVDWRWILLFGIFYSLFLLFSMFYFGLKITLAIFVGSLTVFSSIFVPEIPMLFWMLLIIHEPFMTTVLNLGSGINLTNIFLGLIVLGWMLRAAVRREDLIRPSPINLPILVILTFAFISFLRGMNYFGYGLGSGEMNSFKRYVTFYIVMLLSANMFKDKLWKKIALGVIFSGLSYEIKTTFSQHSAVASWHYSHKLRIPGSFEGGGGANELGTYFAQALPFVFSTFLYVPWWWIKGVSLVILLLGIQALFYTYSRGSYLSFFLGIGVMSFLKDRRLFLVLLVLGTLSFPLWPPSVRERFVSIKHEDASIRGRKHVWKIAREKILKSPIIGYGYDASKYLLPRDTHNMYYDIALEMGLPALIGVIYLFIRVILISYQVWRKARDSIEKIFSLGVIGATFALLLGNLFGTRLAYLPINMYLAVSSGIVVGIYRDLLGSKDGESIVDNRLS